jgi:error-prone DNA polymerase
VYVELHCHSAYSFLDGASQPDELVAAAVQLGYTALALTDHNGVFGSMEHAQAASALGLRAIHGAEVDVADAHGSRHLTLLVEDERGWRNLCRLLTLAHSGTRPDASRRILVAPSVPLEAVLAHAEGLVCLSGCARQGVRDEPTMRRLLDAFGPEHFRVELQRPFQRHDRALNRGLAALAARLGVPCVATGNVHAHARERARLQDVFVAIREHTTLDASEPLRRGNFSHVLASPKSMAARFEDHPDAVRETMALADRLRFDLTSDLGYRYPGAEDADGDRRLAELCWAAFDGRYPLGHRCRSGAQARLDEELRVIRELGLSGFFILHRDLLELAREVAAEVRGVGGDESPRALLPPGRGRGSSVSSIVCYLTGLSHIDPIENELFLGRFLNEELTALPDIDLDFPRDIREVLIPRVHERYGREHSALVAAFPTYKSRGAIREVGKALGLPPGEIERVARVAEPWAQSVDEDIELALGAAEAAAEGTGTARAAAAAGIDDVATTRFGGPDSSLQPLAELFGGDKGWDPANLGEAAAAASGTLQGRWGWLAALAREAYGLPRHLSQHPGGMIVSTRPLIDCVPLVPAAMEGRQICHWDKDSCADAGFLKIDLLGLGMLSAVERCVEEIARTRHERIDLSRIPFDDKQTYDCIQTADTMGVFQIESRAQMQSLLRTRPENLDDLTIQVAIVRPGPIVGGAVNPYIERKQILRTNPDYQVPYEHPSLEPVLKDTLGTIIFQDQVLEVAMAFAGFSPGEAEGLRRAMSRKRSASAIEAYHARFVEGAARTHGADRETAERIFTMIAGFSGFGFPKAHGAAFGLLAYQSTWLRVHYKPEFTCALLNEQPMGFYPSDTLVHEAQRTGIEVLSPDVNHSKVLCHVEDVGGTAERRPRVRIGLGYLNGARADEVAAIVAERDANGPYRSLAELASRSGAGRPALAILAWSGACDSLIGARTEQGRRTALWRLGVASPAVKTQEGSQLALPLELPQAPDLKPLEAWERMVADYATTGLTAGAHPLALLREQLPEDAITSADMEHLRHGVRVRIGGLVVARQRPATANGIVFMLLEDEFGTINLIVPPPTYERDRLVVRGEPLVFAEGRLEKHPKAAGAINIVVDSLRPLDAQPGSTAADVIRLLPAPAEAGGHDELADAVAPRAFAAVAPPVQSFASGRRR